MTDTSTPIAWQNAAKRAVKTGIAIRHLDDETWDVESASRHGEHYLVTVTRDAGGFATGAQCTCTGGYGGRACQHKAAVLLVAPALELLA